jgi:hypothetical protein
LPDRDFAEFLRRDMADPRKDLALSAPGLSMETIEACRFSVLEAQIAILEHSSNAAQRIGEQWRQAARKAADRVVTLEKQVATLEKLLAEAQAIGNQYREEAENSARTIAYLVAEMIAVTNELLNLQTGTAAM